MPRTAAPVSLARGALGGVHRQPLTLEPACDERDRPQARRVIPRAAAVLLQKAYDHLAPEEAVSGDACGGERLVEPGRPGVRRRHRARVRGTERRGGEELGQSTAQEELALGRAATQRRRHARDELRDAVVGERQPEVERSEEHTSELQSHSDLVCRLLLEKKKKKHTKKQ